MTGHSCYHHFPAQLKNVHLLFGFPILFRRSLFKSRHQSLAFAFVCSFCCFCCFSFPTSFFVFSIESVTDRSRIFISSPSFPAKGNPEMTIFVAQNLSNNVLKKNLEGPVFCSSCLTLVRTRWVRSTLSTHCPLSSKPYKPQQRRQFFPLKKIQKC